MSTTWTDEVTCPTCGTVGQHVWSEYGHMDRDEKTVALHGDFRELPRDEAPWDRQAMGSVVCRRCGGGRKVLSHHRGQLEAPKTAAARPSYRGTRWPSWPTIASRCGFTAVTA